MSFIGSVRYIMQELGLQVQFKLFYTEGNVNAMSHDKVLSRVTRAHTLFYTALYGYVTAKLFGCNLGEPYNDGKFTINSSLQTLKELIKGTQEDITSCTMQAHIINILLDKPLVFSNATTSKTITL